MKTRPPTFALFTNLEEVPIFFERYLKSNIQTAFNLQGVPIRFVVRKTKGVNIHRTKKADARGKTPEAGERSARAPSGLGTWRNLAKGGSVKKGLVGPNRDRGYVMRRVSGILRHKRKSEAGKGLVQFTGLKGLKGGLSKKNADSTATPEQKNKDAGTKKTLRRTGRKNQNSRATGESRPAGTGSRNMKVTKAGGPVKRAGKRSPVKTGGRVRAPKPTRKNKGDAGGSGSGDRSSRSGKRSGHSRK